MGGNGVPSFLRQDFSGAALVQGRNSPCEMYYSDSSAKKICFPLVC